jgi:ABC-type transporter Mla MlaB component
MATRRSVTSTAERNPCDATLLSYAGRVWEVWMATGYPKIQQYAAPETLGLETRDRVRKDAIKLLDGMREGYGRLVIDLAKTAKVDSAGLGALMLIQRHAADRRLSVSLANPNDEIRFLLMLTKLDELFESAPASSAG